MKLLEGILEANRIGPPAPERVQVPGDATREALPLAVLSCIDPRLNRLLPARLGVPEDQLIWLRNAGNIVTGPLSSTVRSLALACAIKEAKEIAIIGHTDCKVCQTTMLRLTEVLGRLGIDRHRLPDNLVDYFGLFASERQNVIRAVDLVRTSPLIGPKVPVHGLLLPIDTGRIEVVVNGYETLATAASRLTSALHRAEAAVETALQTLPELADAGHGLSGVSIGDLRVPEIKLSEIQLPKVTIGDVTIDPNRWLKPRKKAPSEGGSSDSGPSTGPTAPDVAPTSEPRTPDSPEAGFDPQRRYKVIGSDHKVYGPIAGQKILQWIAEDRIDWDTPSQMDGSIEWRPLSLWTQIAKKLRPPRLPKP